MQACDSDEQSFLGTMCPQAEELPLASIRSASHDAYHSCSLHLRRLHLRLECVYQGQEARPDSTPESADQ